MINTRLLFSKRNKRQPNKSPKKQPSTSSRKRRKTKIKNLSFPKIPQLFSRDSRSQQVWVHMIKIAPHLKVTLSRREKEKTEAKIVIPWNFVFKSNRQSVLSKQDHRRIESSWTMVYYDFGRGYYSYYHFSNWYVWAYFSISVETQILTMFLWIPSS